MNAPSGVGSSPGGSGAEAYAPFGKPPEHLPRHAPPPPTRAPRGEVRIERLDLSRVRDRRRFLDVADVIQRGDPNYIAPLRLERMR
ncbi:MAG: hypothetical protein ACJ79L_07325, partial [Anaeromyxobacteraceae bacterium]